ncbi:SLC13 family permease [Myxococcota bacterium]
MQERSRQQESRRLFPMNLVVVVALGLLGLWAMVSSPEGTGQSAHGTIVGIAVVLVFVGTFGVLAANLVGRLYPVVGGAAVCLALGIALRFYFPNDAALYLYGKLDTLSLLFGVSVVTALLDESGFFEALATWTLRMVGTSGWRVMASLCALTFLLSMFVNNLAAILVIIPLSLRIADALKLDAVSLVLGEVIASNLGGASTMVGDFPNMLIATETGMHFHEFLLHLTPICLLQLGILVVFLSPAFDRQSTGVTTRTHTVPRHGFNVVPWNKDIASRGLMILGLMVIGFLISGWAGILPPAGISVAGAVLAILFGNVSWSQLLRKSCMKEVLFFACIFVMVGAVDAAGILDQLGVGLGSLWQHNPLIGAVVLAWGAALLTAILNAGPTTALLLHVLLTALGGAAPGETMWWALSLGVCAGSSATLTGATAGPVAAGLLERHGLDLSFGRFARTGIPLMLAFLVVSSCYVVILVSLS